MRKKEKSWLQAVEERNNRKVGLSEAQRVGSKKAFEILQNLQHEKETRFSASGDAQVLPFLVAEQLQEKLTQLPENIQVAVAVIQQELTNSTIELIEASEGAYTFRVTTAGQPNRITVVIVSSDIEKESVYQKKYPRKRSSTEVAEALRKDRVIVLVSMIKTSQEKIRRSFQSYYQQLTNT